MAKSKKKPKKMSAPKALVSTKSKGPSLASQILQPRALSTFAFGISGLLAGIATGLNHFPNMDGTAVIPKMMLLAAYLGDPHADIAAGVATGFAGLMMGACLGFSALSDPKDLAMSLLFSVGLAFLAMTFTGNVALAGLGFLAGHTPAIMAYLRLRHE
jgi:hypothetical protein